MTGADQPGQGRPARLAARAGGVGRRPRLPVGGEPPLPAARRRALDPRREAARQRQEAKAALSRQGRYHTVAENLRVKEVIIGDGTMRERFIICHNPAEAEREQAAASR